MKRIVVFSTSDIQTWVSGDSRLNPMPPKFQSTGELERAIALGFTVYVISTRHKLSDTSDKWWFDQANYVYLATTPMDSSCANTLGLLAPWLKLYDELDIPIEPNNDGECKFNNWLEARDYLSHVILPNAVIVTGSDFKRLYPK